MIELLLKGIIIGFLVAAPVGPIAILCIQRSLYSGFIIGLMTGLGAALADGLFGLIAGLGFSAVFKQLMEHRILIGTLGAICLFLLGAKLVVTPFHEKRISGTETKKWHAFTTAFLLTLTNPLTILAFMAIFATFGLRALDYNSAMFLTAGITLGSTLWWLVLSCTIAFILHHRLSDKTALWINRMAGFVFIGFGVVVILSIIGLESS